MFPVHFKLSPFSFFRVQQPDANCGAAPRHGLAPRKPRNSTRGRFEELESRRVLSALALSPLTLPADTASIPYSQVIAASGGTGTVTLLVTKLTPIGGIPGLVPPAGGTGSLAISGTPTAAGTESFTVTATDPAGDTPASAKYTITINPVVSLNLAALPGDTVNIPYSQTIAASGGTGTVTLNVTNIQNPQGLPLLVPASGTGTLTISSTSPPTATGTETFTVTATDSLGATASTNYSITVNPVVSLNPAPLPADTQYVAYNQTITAIGGTNPTLAVSAITNPIPGLNVPTSGSGSLTISGTPKGTGTETFTVTANDSAGGPSSSATYSITVNPWVDPPGIVLTSIPGFGTGLQGTASFLDQSGDLVVAGGAGNNIAVVRYLPNGSLDTSFNGTGITTSAGPSPGPIIAYGAADYPTTASSPSDKIVIGGEFLPGKGGVLSEFALARYNTNGSLDTTFGTKGEVVTNIGIGESAVDGVVVLPSGAGSMAGDIVAAGFAVDSNSNGDFALACYTPAGTLNTAFKPAAGDPVGFTAPKGIVTTDFGGVGQRIYSVALQTVYNPVTKTDTYYILASGMATINGTRYDVLARYNLNGTLDKSFGANGWVETQITGQPTSSVIVDPSGDIFVGGAAAGGSLSIEEYLPNGTQDAADTTFAANIASYGILAGGVNLAIQPNGQIVAAGIVLPGVFNSPNPELVARFASDGTLDPSFDPLGVVPGIAVAATSAPLYPSSDSVDIQSNGGIDIAGMAWIPAAPLNFVTVAQFSSSGILNTSFGNPAAKAQSVSSPARLSSATAVTTASISALAWPMTAASVGSPAGGTETNASSRSLVSEQPVSVTSAQKPAAHQGIALVGLQAWSVDRVFADLSPQT